MMISEENMIQEKANKAYRRTVNRIGLCLLVMLGLMSTVSLLSVSVESILSEFFGENIAHVVGGVVETICYMSYFVVPAILFYTMMGKHPTQPIRFRLKMPWTTPLLILSGIAVVLVFAQLNAWLLEWIGYESALGGWFDTRIDSPAAIVMYMTISFAPAIAEEFLFRGVIYGNLRPYGRGVAVIGSALLFALMHQTPDQIIYTFVAGIVLAWVYEVTGSIWGCTFLHLFNNLHSVIQTILLDLEDYWLAENIILFMDIAIYVLGAVSLVILFAVAWCHRDGSVETTNLQEGSSYRKSWFGAFPSDIDEDGAMLTTRNVHAVIRPFVSTPGMLIYIVLTAATILLMLISGLTGGII
jgi:membrane protease YdiL (CAAX protease family)